MSAGRLVFEAARDLDEVTRLAEALRAPLASETRARLAAFGELVARWNERVDLTAARTAEQLCEVLFADALVLASRSGVGQSDPSGRDGLVPRGARVLDVGSGAGAPALPLAVVRADVSLVLVEPLRKRVAFLRTAVGTIDGLAGRVEVRGERLDVGAPAVAGSPFDVAMARATFAPSVWLPLALGLASRALVLTANEAPPAAPEGARIMHEERYVLPRTGATRTITAYCRA